jgi:acetoin utilization protein AcuB
MRVNAWMTTDVITIKPDSDIKSAISVMRKHSIRHLPVIEDKAFVGLVSMGDLKQAILTSMIEHLNVKDMMIVKPITITSDTPLEKAARIIYEKNIGCLPVLDNGKLVGIITTNDILRAFIEIMGVLKAGIRIDVILKHVHGSMDEVISIIESKGGFIISVGMTIDGPDTIHHFRISGGDAAAIAKELVDLGYKRVKITE